MEKPKKKEITNAHIKNLHQKRLDCYGYEYEEGIKYGYNQYWDKWEKYHIQEIDRLKKGENDWWQKRWQNNDTGKQLFEIRKKWLTAYQCAENYQKMYEELKIDREKWLKYKQICDKCKRVLDKIPDEE